MSALDRKLLRDLVGMWTQAIAISLVVAAGVATLIMAVGAYRSLDETRAAYYERHRFAHVFATATRAPRGLMERILELPGVASAEGRITKNALLDIDGFEKPATGLVISLPAKGLPVLNRLYVRAGRLPLPEETTTVVVNEDFAEAHGFRVGSRFQALLGGRKRTLNIVGIALSPEFIYAVGPGDFVPDDTRFGILWMGKKAVEASYDLDNAFNSLSLLLRRDASEDEVIRRLDLLLERYGGRGAYGRDDQFSHAFLDSELMQLSAMARVLPPIFMVVTAFLINMILTRLIALEREQIGLLKALGYRRIAIAMHYIKLVMVIAVVGVVIGFGLGTWLGDFLTRIYGGFFHFPFLVFQRSVDIYVISAAVALASAGIGAARAVWSAMKLPPAVAMQPPAPTVYRRLWAGGAFLLSHVSQLTIMVFRHLVRWPWRAATTTIGIALSVAVLITSLFAVGSVNFMLDFTFFQTDRQDASITFANETPSRVVQDVAQLPGVMVVEPFRSVSTKMRWGHNERRVSIIGRPAGTDLSALSDAPVPAERRRGGTDLSQLMNANMEPVTLPETGLVVTEKLAQLLGVRRGDLVEVEFLESSRRTLGVPVTEIFQSYFGLAAFMNIRALNDLLDEGRVVTGVHIAIDEKFEPVLYDVIKNTPALTAIALQKVSLVKFRETMAENITFMTGVYSVLGIIIAFGVAYNSARIQLSERARELASLRVLGFTRGEVARILTIELAIVTLAAIPIGWVLGAGFAWSLIQSFESELYRVPFIIERSTYAHAALVVIGAVVLSAMIVRRRVNRLDLIEVLKTRE